MRQKGTQETEEGFFWWNLTSFPDQKPLATRRARKKPSPDDIYKSPTANAALHGNDSGTQQAGLTRLSHS